MTLKKLTACLRPLFVAVLFLASSCEQGDKKITLRYKFEPGLTLTYDQTVKRNYKVMEADSLIREAMTTLNARVIQSIQEVNDNGTAVMDETDTWYYERPSQKDTTRMEKIEETRNLKLTVKPDGDIVDVDFLDDESQSTRAYIKNYLEQGMPVFPPGEISVGFNWTQSAKVMMPSQTMEASTTYEVKALVREAGFDCAVIEFDGNLIIPIEPDPTDSVKISGVDKINTTGKLYFAYKEGLVVLQRERWVVDGTRNYVTPKGEEKHRKVAMETDVEYALKDRSNKPEQP